VNVEYGEEPAGGVLAPSVEAFWWMRGSVAGAAPQVDKALPDGCLELVLHLGDPFAAARTPERLAIQPAGVLVRAR
jgi:hypothetical protein